MTAHCWLLRARFFPRFERANALPAWRWHLGPGLLAATGMAVGTATLATALSVRWAVFFATTAKHRESLSELLLDPYLIWYTTYIKHSVLSNEKKYRGGFDFRLPKSIEASGLFISFR